MTVTHKTISKTAKITKKPTFGLHNLVIDHYKRLTDSPVNAQIFILKASLDIAVSHIPPADSYIIPSAADGCYIARIGADIIGCLTYTDQSSNWKNEYAAGNGYVLTEYRGRQVYKRLWKRLVEDASKAGIAHIYGSTGVDNLLMQDVMEGLGRTKVRVGYTYAVPKTPKKVKKSSKTAKK